MSTETTLTPERLIALEDARNWINDAIEAVANSDTRRAVYSTHTAIAFATDARDTLIGRLIPMSDD